LAAIRVAAGRIAVGVLVGVEVAVAVGNGVSVGAGVDVGDTVGVGLGSVVAVGAAVTACSGKGSAALPDGAASGAVLAAALAAARRLDGDSSASKPTKTMATMTTDTPNARPNVGNNHGRDVRLLSEDGSSVIECS
jgi:hypothetical protein